MDEIKLRTLSGPGDLERLAQEAKAARDDYETRMEAQRAEVARVELQEANRKAAVDLQAAFRDRLGIQIPLPDGPRVTIDGLTFEAGWHYGAYLPHLIRTCLICGLEVRAPVADLARLGQFLGDQPPEVHEEYECRMYYRQTHPEPEPESVPADDTAERPQPSPGERLLAALEEWMVSKSIPF